MACAMDREADFLDLFIERRTHAPQVEPLVRAKVDRVPGKEETTDGRTVSRRLFEEVRNAPARGTATVEVRRLSARVKASKQARKDRRAARDADVTLRYQPVALPCSGAEPVNLFVVHAREEQPPPGVKPLEWFVLTTLPVTARPTPRGSCTGMRCAGASKSTSGSSSPAARSRSCSTTRPSGSNGPWRSRWSSGGGSS